MLLICRECRHIFWRRMPTPERMARYYAKAYNGKHDQTAIQEANQNYYHSHVAELAAHEKVGADALRIADIGCSAPVFLRCAKEAGADVLGVDHDETAMARGSDWGIPMLQPDRFVSDAPDGTFDILRLVHTIEHLIDPVGALGAFLPKLRSGGLVFISQPSFPIMRAAKARVRLEDSIWPEHLHFFNALSMLRLCQRVGLTVEKFFTADNAEVRQATYCQFADLAHTRTKTQSMADHGEALFGPLNNYPHWMGANMIVYARRS